MSALTQPDTKHFYVAENCSADCSAVGTPVLTASLPLADTSAAAPPASGPVLMCSWPMQTAYDVLQQSTQSSRFKLRSTRQYSRHARHILQFFTQHRTALAAHVRRQLPHLFHSDRATRMHLQTLVANKDLAILEGRGIREPNVYVLTQKGLRMFQQRTGDTASEDRRARRHLPTGSHVLHELLITEFAVSLAEALRPRPDLAIPWQDRFGLTEHSAFRTLIPDYAFLLRHAHGFMACLVEVFSGEESSTRIREKLQAYATWSVSPEAQGFLVGLYKQHGAQNPRPQFRLLLIAHDRRFGNDLGRLRQMFQEAMQLPRSMRHRLWAATVKDLGATKSVDAPVWSRVRDLQAHTPAWETLTPRERHQRLTALFPSLPRHRLFPALEDTSHDTPPPDQPERLVASPGTDQPHGTDRVAHP